jgi:hypothetical protein
LQSSRKEEEEEEEEEERREEGEAIGSYLYIDVVN